MVRTRIIPDTWPGTSFLEAQRAGPADLLMPTQKDDQGWIQLSRLHSSEFYFLLSFSLLACVFCISHHFIPVKPRPHKHRWMLTLKGYSVFSGVGGRTGLSICQGPGEEGFAKSAPFLFLFREFRNMPMQSLPVKFTIFSPDKRWPLISFYFWPSKWTQCSPWSNSCRKLTC